MTEIELWQVVLSELELATTRATFAAWFKNTRISSKKDGVVSVAVPNGFAREWLQTKYKTPVLKALRDTSSEIKDVKFVIETGRRVAPTSSIGYSRPKNIGSQLVFEELEVDAFTNLNPKYSFASFVVGPSNEFAHAAALSVSKQMPGSHNPLFVYGGVGLGKTHLLQAIGNSLSKQNKSVLYLTSEKFTNDFISAIQNGSKNSFNEKYRNKDALIIDDVQFMAGKERTQEEFFHTFNSLYDKNKKIILSSDKPPKAISTLEERLRSRFEGGMIVDVGNPDYETRLAILQNKIKERKVSVESSILEYIAMSIKNNVRELEGALNLIIASSKSLYDNKMTQEKAKKILSRLLNAPQKAISHKHIIKTVASFYEIKEEEILRKNRKQEIVLPRQIIMFLMRDELKRSYPSIGTQLGGRDHTTVMHACDKIKNKISEDSRFEDELNLIKQTLYSV